MASLLRLLLLLLLLLASFNLPLLHSLPLSTSGRFIVDAATGNRVKLRCVNWAAHLPTVLPEGLDRQPLCSIASRIASLGFNCVRLTYATRAFTDPRYVGLTVMGSLERLGLKAAAEGVRRNNRWIVETTTVADAMDATVRAAGEAGLMVVLDNHVSEPMWCCGADDGNGFFGDRYFDGDEWLRGLQAVAARYRDFPEVVGMSLRNELRGPNQSEPVWYEYITRGARTVHNANPDLLIIVSGLSYDSDLSFLNARPLALHLDKLVFEAHWYSFSEGRRSEWENQSPTQVCSGVTSRFDGRAGFINRLGENRSMPLFISEFGIDQRGMNRADNRFLSCFLSFAAERDVDWAMWALQGSYYWRAGRAGFEETYGVLDSGWDQPKNPRFRERFRLVQEMLQDPQSSLPAYQIIYHPLSGLCLQVDEGQNVVLADCVTRSKWHYVGGGSPIQLHGTDLCLRVVGDGYPATLAVSCDGPESGWKTASDIGYQLGGIDEEGRRLCLHWNGSNSSQVVTTECACLGGTACPENPQTQWFRVVSSNVE